jgi:hypothetical protein
MKPGGATMKIRQLKRKFGAVIESTWPPRWTSSMHPRGEIEVLVGEEGTLESVKRIGEHLSLTMKYKGQERFGSLEWDAPPSLDAVEKVLQANLGKPIKTIGDVYV